MEHSCHKCGQSVEDGVPFCAHCRAPQIRVALPEPAGSAAGGNISSDGLPAFSVDVPSVPGTLSSPALSTGIAWPRALRACAVAALISIVVMSLRLFFPLVTALGAGFLAVIFYHRRNPATRLDARSGAQLGAVTGLFSSAVFAILSAMVFAVLHAGGQVRQQMLEALQQVASRSNDPQMQTALELLKNPEGLAAKLMLGAVGFFLIAVAAGSIAGALTGTALGRRNRL